MIASRTQSFLTYDTRARSGWITLVFEEHDYFFYRIKHMVFTQVNLMHTHIQKHIVFTQECHSASSTSRSFTSFVLSHCVYLSKVQGWWSTFISFTPCVLDNGVYVCGTFRSLLCGTCSLPLSGLRVSKAFILACVRVWRFTSSS
jgi:hypothetical protein